MTVENGWRTKVEWMGCKQGEKLMIDNETTAKSVWLATSASGKVSRIFWEKAYVHCMLCISLVWHFFAVEFVIVLTFLPSSHFIPSWACRFAPFAMLSWRSIHHKGFVLNPMLQTSEPAGQKRSFFAMRDLRSIHDKIGKSM